MTLMLYFLLAKRKWTPLKCIGLLLVIGLVGLGLRSVAVNLAVIPQA